MDFSSATKKCLDFRSMLENVKAANKPADFSWYGYDIPSSILHVDELLKDDGRKGDERDLFERVAGQPIADIGAADGVCRSSSNRWATRSISWTGPPRTGIRCAARAD